MSLLISELQKTDPSAIIELFELQLSQNLHGATTIYRWHSGVAANSAGELVLDGVTYSAMPIEAEGFEFTGTSEIKEDGRWNEFIRYAEEYPRYSTNTHKKTDR